MSNYEDHAYERSVVTWLQRVLLDRTVASDTVPRETIICEEVFFNQREVPQEVLHRVLAKLSQWETHERTEMSKYRWTRDKEQVPPFLQQSAQEEKKEPPPPAEQPQQAAQPAVETNGVPAPPVLSAEENEGEDESDESTRATREEVPAGKRRRAAG